MRASRLTLTTHLLLLSGYALIATGLIMLPVLLAGFPYKLPWLVVAARSVAAHGATDAIRDTIPLLVWIFTWLHRFIAWDNIVGWTGVSAAFFGLSLLPWWWVVRRLFDVRVAWCSTIILSLLPQYWQEVIEFSGYSLSLFLLFLGFALFVDLRQKHHLLAVAVAGMSLGAVVASNHAFITFPPFFLLAYLWHERKHALRACRAAALGCAAMAFAFVLPLLPLALQPGHTLQERIAVLLPSGEKPGTGHLYPDQYTYDFLKADYDAKVQQEMEDASFLERQANANYGIIFGAVKTGILGSIGNGVWLFLNVLPSFFFEETVGGVFLWLFIIPGIALLWRERRALLLYSIGLWLWMEFCLRFVLHFGRAHLNDVAWGLTLFAAIGIVRVVSELAHGRKKFRPARVTAGIVLLLALQLLQANRTTLAKRYARSDVPLVYAATEALRSVPVDATVAHPRRENLFFFASQKAVELHPDTIATLAAKGRLQEPFLYYGVGYIIGYDTDQTQAILAANPTIKAIPLPDPPPPVPVSDVGRFLLNLTR